MRGRILTVALVLVAIGCSSKPEDTYAAYRQTSVQEVPGAFDWELRPIDDDSFRATIDPADAYDRVFGAGKQPEAIAVLAQVANTLEDSVAPPAWVFITPHTCFATEKGDLVSPGRTGDGCTEENLYVQGVNATTGEVLGGFTAYEPPGGWAPDRAGTPPVVEATTQLGTTRLH